MPFVGDMAPDFTLPDQTGRLVSLSDLRGRKVVLYFYPKDGTAGCARQAEAMNARRAEIKALGAHLLGISRDSVKSHAKFAEALGLSFPILADPALQVINAYGVFREKTMYGKKVMGVVRTVFVIDENGVIEAVLEKVKPGGSADDAVQYLSGKGA